ncbi:hypothetical protein [Streptomyces platensis]|uniref:hypothetical protein n=1 Tax=Streptomyces platensis TaxID=58346 RepID=UPI00367BE79B
MVISCSLCDITVTCTGTSCAIGCLPHCEGCKTYCDEPVGERQPDPELARQFREEGMAFCAKGMTQVKLTEFLEQLLDTHLYSHQEIQGVLPDVEFSGSVDDLLSRFGLQERAEAGTTSPSAAGPSTAKRDHL